MRAESISSHCSTRDTFYAARPSRLKLSRASSLAGTIACILLFCLGTIAPGYGQGSGQDLTGRPADLQPGQRPSVVKFRADGWSSMRSPQALRDEAVAALAEARHIGWDGLVAGQRAYLDEFWDRADVEIDGDTELQQAVRFALFHTL